MIGNILPWLQERIQRWTKPASLPSIPGLLSDITRSRADLMIENAMLRQQLIVLNQQIKRPPLTNPDRFRLVLLSHFTIFWKQALHIVQPDTLLRWHRELFRLYWRCKSQGKPKISSETIGLLHKMAKENQLWGAERIRGELLKLEIEVSKRSIQKYMPKERRSRFSSRIVPTPLRETWATFLKNQAKGCQLPVWCNYSIRSRLKTALYKVSNKSETAKPPQVWSALRILKQARGQWFLGRSCTYEHSSLI